MDTYEKILHYANFNITYGDNHEPMLSYFEEIIWPAFHMDYIRGKKDEYPKYYFSDVMIKCIDDDICIVGNYIKETEYNIKTIAKDKSLVSAPSRVPSAPYSRFIIFLKNHKMILIRNESQSPDVRSFQLTAKGMLKKYIGDINRTKNKDDIKLPKIHVNIVNMDLPHEIDEMIKNVKKIKSLKMRFFPLNNDVNPSTFAEDIDREMKRMKTERAHAKFISPESKEEVAKIMKQSSGLAESTLEVVNQNDVVEKIKNSDFTSSTKIQIAHDVEPRDDAYIIEQAKKEPILSIVSTANADIYKKKKSALLKFF